MNDPVDRILREMHDIENQHGEKIAVDRYRMLQERLKVMEAPPSPFPPMTVPEAEMLKAIGKTGIGMPMTIKNNPWGQIENIADIFLETTKWHKACIEVFEYMAAQTNMDLFKNNPEAKQVFERVMMKGFQALHNEANGGYR